MNRKGTSDLWSQVISVDNLREAAKTAYKNANNKQHSMIAFMEKLEDNILELNKKLTDWTYKTGPYSHSKIKEPKERQISSLPFKDKVVQHAILQIILPIWMTKFTKDTYNCLKGRGTHGFVRNIQKTIKFHKVGTKYVLQMDVRHYYPSLNHNTLKRIVTWTIKDQRLQRLIFEIIDSEPQGVPIGNYLSQFLATLYLTPFDHYVKEIIKAKYYFRYCDDLVFFASTKKELWRIYKLVIQYMEGIHLTIKPNARIFPLDTGLDVVGYVFYPDHTRLRKRNKLKFERKCAQAHADGLTGTAFKVKIGSYLGLLRYCNSTNLKRKWFGKDYDICTMNKFKDIADEEDLKYESYEGEQVSIETLVNKTVQFESFREFKKNGKDKIIVQITDGDTKKYFFTGAGRLKDLFKKYKDQLPFEATITKALNPKTNNEFFTLK